VSVVVPTYDRAGLLRGTLTALAAQQPPPGGRFEVVVSDDGSTDGTREVVAAFTGRLALRYHFQPDRGFRAAAARNAGARLAAAPLLVFLDAGVRPGPGFVRAHLTAQAAGPRAVIGYTYGYRPDADPAAGPAGLDGLEPAEALRRFGDTAALRDARHLAFERFGFDLDRALVPWQWFWSVNCAVPADAFRAVGGFDEDFRSWGGEDLDLGHRLHRAGLPFTVSRAAWALDTPHERSLGDDLASNAANIALLAAKRPEPVTELLWAFFAGLSGEFVISHDWNVEDEYRLVLDAADRVRDLDVTAELAVLREAEDPDRVAVLGCGPVSPGRLPPGAHLFDFDARHTGDGVGHLLGVRAPLAPGSVDRVLVTSRLAGLWDRWGAHIRAEAGRLGARIDTPFAVGH
jgi:glycosyltransferase involved in cell wall biosynthesis